MHEPGNAAALPTKVAVEAHCRSPWRPKRRGGGCHGVVRASPNHTRRGGELAPSTPWSALDRGAEALRLAEVRNAMSGGVAAGPVLGRWRPKTSRGGEGRRAL